MRSPDPALWRHQSIACLLDVPRLTVRFVSVPHFGHTKRMSSNSSVAGRMALAPICSPQPGHRTIGNFSGTLRIRAPRLEAVPSLLFLLARRWWLKGEAGRARLCSPLFSVRVAKKTQNTARHTGWARRLSLCNQSFRREVEKVVDDGIAAACFSQLGVQLACHERRPASSPRRLTWAPGIAAVQ